MRHNAVPLAIAVFFIVGIILGAIYYVPRSLPTWEKIGNAANAPSRIYARMTIRYDKPPIYKEEYRMKDIEGISSFQYLIRGYNGKEVTITAPPAAIYDVSYFFGELQQDGVWGLMNKPPRGDTSAHYTIYVKQVVDFKHGSRTITFTDPHYWATTAGQQYHIDLSKQNPADILTLKGTALADPHYAKVVADFRAFGPASFRSKIARIRASYYSK